jgi:hypothetical protein
MGRGMRGAEGETKGRRRLTPNHVISLTPSLPSSFCLLTSQPPRLTPVYLWVESVGRG